MIVVAFNFLKSGKEKKLHKILENVRDLYIWLKYQTAREELTTYHMLSPKCGGVCLS